MGNRGAGRNTGGGNNSKSFRGGSNPHIGASRSQSGSNTGGYRPPTRTPKNTQTGGIFNLGNAFGSSSSKKKSGGSGNKKNRW